MNSFRLGSHKLRQFNERMMAIVSRIKKKCSDVASSNSIAQNSVLTSIGWVASIFVTKRVLFLSELA